MNKCTVVSTLPFALTEDKYGLIPFRYEIPAATKDKVSTLVVGDGYHLYLIPLSDDRNPPMKIVDTADRIAEGLCQDYIGASIAVNYTTQENGSVSAPGLFWVDDKLTDIEVMTKHSKKVEQAKMNTAAWFTSLVKIADDDWARSHQHRAISDLQRSACRYLNIEREWNFSAINSVVALCWACKASVNPLAILCNSCRAILKPEEYEKNKARFVTQ